MALHPTLDRVSARIRARSARTRTAYLAGIAAARGEGPQRRKLSCANLAHGFAGTPWDRERLRDSVVPNLGIVSAYNDMLSAHQPFEDYPARIRAAARALGATAQVAGGVPAMCDGVHAGAPGAWSCRCSRAT